MTEVVLQGLVGLICYVFIDDIIVYAPTEAEFLARLRLVLQRLQRHHIVLKGAKCHFGCPDVKFLGFIADASGIRHDPSRCADFLALPLPHSKKDLRSFLGLGNFFRDFVPNYSNYSKRLSKLLSTGTSLAVDYTEEARTAFDSLKTLIGGSVKNFYLDYDHPIYLHTDASTSGIGAILFQIVDSQFRPIQFVSRSLSDVEVRWQIQELESFAIVHAITKLDHFLKGAHFIVHTDHRNLVFIRHSKSAKIIRWHLFLQEYSFDLSVVLGSHNLIADVLSRSFPTRAATDFAVQPLPPPDVSYVDYCSLNSRYVHPSPTMPHLEAIPTLAITPIPTPSDDNLASISRYHNDAFGHYPSSDVSRMMTAHDHNWPTLRSDIDYVIATCATCTDATQFDPPTFPITPDQLVILRDHHNHLMGHHGIDTTLKLLRLNGHSWDGLKSHVVNLIQSCGHCQKNKSRSAISIPEFTTTETYEPFVTVAIDTLGPFPPSRRGHLYVFVIVCCFSSYVELVPSVDNTAQSAAEALLTVFGRYGAAFYLRSDNAPNFAGHVMAAFRHILDISADFTIPYRPQSNGIVERKNLNVLTHLRALLTTNLDVINNWHSLLPIAQRICNATDVSSIGCAPAQLIFGNMIHLNRGLDSDFTPPLPHTKGATDYILSLLWPTGLDLGFSASSSVS
jgi:transposase InsO family protein